MVFTIGNLLTIAIVLVVLAIYRQLDRGNRSLDKVRRYADKVKEDLASVVLEKVQGLKDLSIDLEVHQKAARELLKKIQATEASMDGRMKEVEAVGQRIKEYDQVLGDLVQMTKRADENMLRIRDESEFADSVAKRIKALALQLEEQEKSIPALVQEFQGMNSLALRAVEDRIVEEGQGRVDALKDEVAAADARVAGFQSVAADLLKGLEATTETGRRELETVRKELRDDLDDDRRRAIQAFEQDLADLRVGFEKVEEDYSERLADVARRGGQLETEAFGQVKELIRSQVERLEGDLYKSGQDLDAKLEQIRENAVRDLDTVTMRIGQDLDAKTAGLAADVERRLQTLSATTDATHQRIDEVMVSLKERVDRMQRNTQTLEANMQGLEAVSVDMGRRTAELEDALVRHGEEFGARILTTGEAIESTVIGALESRLTDYEKDLAYRLSKIEETASEMDRLEERLKQTMDRVADKTKEEFLAFGADLHKQQEADKSRLEAEVAALGSAMGELEQGLNELKNRAYENVSEKLRVFEDEFFRDIKERDEAMQERFAEWQRVQASRLEGLSAEAAASREATELRYSEELTARLVDFQARIYAQYEKFQQQVDELRSGLSLRMEQADQASAAAEVSFRAALDSTRESMEARAKSEFNRHSASLSAELEKQQRSVEGRMRVIEEGLESGKTNLTRGLDAARSELAVWQATLVQQFKSAEADVTGQFAAFKVQVSDLVSGLREEFAGQREDLISFTSDERYRLKEELNSLRTDVDGLDHDLRKRTEEVLDQFSGRFQSFQYDFTRKTRDFQAESETKMREYRTLLQDTREQFDSTIQKLTTKVEDGYRVLSVNLTEIDKRQKSFVEQTKIFERADSLKLALQQDIEAFKAELARLDTQRKELKETENLFVKMKKLGDEVSEKMTRFNADKRRIDLIEDDYKKLSNMSVAVEQRLTQVTATQDTLQNVLAGLRSLDGLQKEVEQRFERLEKKRNLLDTTMEGVDRNFAELGGMEKRLGTISGELDAAGSELERAEERISQLAANKEQADRALKQLAGVDKLLSELEARTDKLMQAREWLARTETRLEEVSRDAQEQVKLLGTLLKEEARTSAKKEKGAPSMSARETVTKLARQGWTAEQISRATKLSRGEVELILELSGK